ncbi:1-acyl-sn-glycerol-3-phosphate acyltransferase delta-like [Xenia sp. Carnegie-2017]|uniref:1-acyl-sn-glycerol-3-phosphate acyltransferase delta-like n=1 Tax=Xenia sp. Carnegie-2017 TaxID=2897299 RepID=UPI001F04EC29|nr:1-acyl-sn-glycerol-3-phosphate acyltransferase delta-like [Xenia sp. Carnegie-2017]XP_046847785.1 1-acyl-sn-glycerol-3-phosphate acyltransferase delta-like [Xenia sp. Carnegie-2017]
MRRSLALFLWLLMVYFISGLIVNILQVCLLPLWYISRNHFRRINAVLCYSHWSMLTFAGEWWGELDIKFYGKKEDYDLIGKEHCLVLPNHRSDIDWMIGWILCERTGILGGAKCYMKYYLKYLPVIGWMWWCAEYVFLKRNWNADFPMLKRSLDELKDYPIPMFLGIFPEGTRFTEAKHENSLQFSRSRGLPELKHHLFPRTKGVIITLKCLKDTLPAVYDIESAYPGDCKPTMKHLLKGGKCEVHFYLRRIPIEEIPCNSDDEISKWCTQLFVEKDAIMSDFVKNGKFAGNRVNLPRRQKNLYFVIFWNLLLSAPILYTLYSLLVSRLVVSIPVVGALLLIGYVAFRILVHFTDSKKGSKFGLKQNSKVQKEERNGLHDDGVKQD